MRSPAVAPTDDDPAVADRRGIERVDRLAELEHDVVLGVDDVADRAAGRPRAAASGRGRATDRPSRRRSSGRRSAGTGRCRAPRPRGARRRAGRSRPRRSAGKRTGAPVTAATSRASPTIDSASPRFGLTSTSRTTSPYRSASGAPSGVSAGRIRIPSASAVRPSSSPEQSIPLLDDAHLLGPLDAPVAGQDRAGQRDRHALAGRDVRRAADDLERLAGADVDPGQRQPVGARVLARPRAARRRRRSASRRPGARCP